MRPPTCPASGRRHWAGLLLACLPSLAAAQPPALQPAETLAEVWRLVDEHFFDPQLRGIDWPGQLARYRQPAAACRTPAELAEVAAQMLEPLHASHTSYFSSDDPRYYQILGVFAGAFPELGADAARYAGIGIATRVLEGRTFISGVYEGHAAAAAGLMVGDELLAVDGAPFHPVRSFRGKVGETVTVEIRRQAAGAVQPIPVEVQTLDGQTMFETALRASARVFERQGKKIGYVHVWSYAGEQYHELLRELVFSDPLQGCDALVVDLRDGWGGAHPEYLRLFLPPVVALTAIDRSGSRQTRSGVWERPVGLLINGGTTSGKEILAYAFRKYDRGPLVGDRTAGAVLAGRCFLLPNRDLLYLAVADVEVDGQRLEGIGVEPTVVVERPLPYAAGSDPQLERLLAWLAGS